MSRHRLTAERLEPILCDRFRRLFKDELAQHRAAHAKAKRAQERNDKRAAEYRREGLRA